MGSGLGIGFWLLQDPQKSGQASEQIYLGHIDAVVFPIAHIHIKPPRLTKQGFVAGSAAAIAVASGAGDEGLGEVLGERGGYGSGFG